MTADTPPSEANLDAIVAKLLSRTSHQVFNQRVAHEITLLRAERAALLRERDAQAKVIAQLQSAILKQAADLVTGEYLPDLPEGVPLGYRQVARGIDNAAEQHRLAGIALRNVYDAARAGLNAQGSGNG